MSNRDLSIGSTFLRQSLYEIASLQVGRPEWYSPSSEPLKFKIFQNTQFYPLHQKVPLALGDARWSFQTFRQGQRAIPRLEKFDIELLSTLLYYTYGFSRYDSGPGVSWPFHRFVASARCFFPTELYVWLPQIEQMPAGIYHYNALHQGLALIRSGDYRHILSAAMDTYLDDCACILLFSSFFWKAAFQYINFAYRLCMQEVGLVISNALIVAATLGLQGCVHYQFLDRPLNRLLGCESGEESLMALVALFPRKSSAEQEIKRIRTHTTAQTLYTQIPQVQLEYIKTSSLDRELCARLLELDQNSFLEETTEIVCSTTAGFTRCVSSEEYIAPPVPSPEYLELAQVLHSRSSGDVEFLPLSRPLAQSAFWEIVRYALSEYSRDTHSMPAVPWLQLYLVVTNVEGLEKGIYRFCTECGMLHIIERRNISLPLQMLQIQRNIASVQASMICFIAADYEVASRLFGNRAYRLVNIETGIVAQRISVMSASYGLVARYSNSYPVASCRELLHLADSAFVPLAELVLGYEAPGSHADTRYRLSLRG